MLKIEARGALRFSSEDAALEALDAYAREGYGVTAREDWLQSGEHLFLERALEFDADMVGYEACFEALVARSAEGEVDLRQARRKKFRRLAFDDQKRAVVRTELGANFGKPYELRVAQWASAFAAASGKGSAAASARPRSREEVDSEKGLLAAHALGSPAQGILAVGEALYVLAGGHLHELRGSERVRSVAVDAGHGFGSFLVCEGGLVAVWSDYSNTLTLVQGEQARSVALARAEGAPPHEDRARVREVFPGKNAGELLVREEYSLRRVDVATAREVGAVALPPPRDFDGPPVDEEPRARVAARSRFGARLRDGVVLLSKQDEKDALYFVDDGLVVRGVSRHEARVMTLLVSGGALRVVEGESYGPARLLGFDGATARELDALDGGGRATMLAEGELVLVSSSTARFLQAKRSVRTPMSARAVVSPGRDRVAFAELSYGGVVAAYVGGKLRFEADAKTNLRGLAWVGDALLGWGNGGALYELREGAAKPTRWLGHRASVHSLVALDDVRFASLDESGELRVWDRARRASS